MTHKEALAQVGDMNIPADIKFKLYGIMTDLNNSTFDRGMDEGQRIYAKYNYLAPTPPRQPDTASHTMD